MGRSLELKKVGETTRHIERAMRVADACLAQVLGGTFCWGYRTFETTGVQETGSIGPSPEPGKMLHSLAANVQISGEIDCGLIWSIRAAIKFTGQEGPHEPSGNIVRHLHVQRVEVVHNNKTYMFVEGCIPGIKSGE